MRLKTTSMAVGALHLGEEGPRKPLAGSRGCSRWQGGPDHDVRQPWLLACCGHAWRQRQHVGHAGRLAPCCDLQDARQGFRCA